MSGPAGLLRASPRAVGWVLLALACVLAAAVAVRQPFSVPQPGFMVDIAGWSPSSPIADTFTPLAYPLLLAPAFRVAGIHGMVAVQAVVYAATVAASYLLLLLLELPATVAGLGALLTLLDPELLLTIAKIWDVGLSAFLFLLLVLVCVSMQRVGLRGWLSPALGAVLGAALFCRPNFLVLAPVILYAIWTGPARPAGWRLVWFSGGAALVAAMVFALAGVGAHGAPFVPRNGPYNLYAGNNPLSAGMLLGKLNGEPSLAPALRAAHPKLVPADPPQDFYFSAALEPVYTHDALQFMREHPGAECGLVAIKLMTLLRPDTKLHPLRSAAGMGKAVVALPAVLFLVALLIPGRAAFGRVDWLLLAFAAAYVLPFLLTNSDPRFRTPLDPLLLMLAFRLYFRRRGTEGAIAATGP